jgi:hypothetical protein
VAEGEEVEVKLRRFVVEDGGGRLENELGWGEGVGVGQEIDEEEATYRGAETGVERVLVGGGLEAEDGEEGVG